MAFVFEKPKDFSFIAGQYVVMTLPNLLFPDTRRGIRSLSIASAPYEDQLVFAMRMTESGFKRTLSALEPGGEVTVTQAVGHFVLPQEDKSPVVFLVGGIGITPARSILRQAAHEGDAREFFLFYSNRLPEDASFAAELQDIPELHYRCIDTLTECDPTQCVWQEESGYIGEGMLSKYLSDLHAPLYYVVGSPAFAQAMKEALNRVGVPSDRIKQDPFTGI